MPASPSKFAALQDPRAGGRVLSCAAPWSKGATAVSVVWGEGLAGPWCTNPDLTEAGTPALAWGEGLPAHSNAERSWRGSFLLPRIPRAARAGCRGNPTLLAEPARAAGLSHYRK